MNYLLHRTRCFQFALIGLILPAARGASLKPETVKAWDEYIQAADVRVQQRLSPGSRFLWMDEAPDRAVKVRNKRIVVAPFGPHIPKKVPHGLIHDWIAVAYLP